MIKVSDTIAAIATGMNQGGIGVIRVSGEKAITIVDSVFVPKRKGKEIRYLSTYTAAYGNIVDEQHNIIDEVIVLVMKAPATYTKEDVVEIDCHGGMHVMQQILHILIQRGARLADPGEFTKRAFLNGRIDLSQAESVMDLISAKSDLAAKTAVSQLKGSLKNKIISLRDMLIHKVAYIESALDDPEHFSIDGYGEKLSKIIEGISKEIEILLASSENGELLKEGINTVIIGKPNAGKSSLMNVLLGRERAIVTDIAGTTRDALEEQINLNGITLNIVDTAGIRDTEDIVEKIGVDKAKEYLKSANLIIYVVDSSTELDQNDEEIISMLSDKKAIILLNKSDLSQVTSQEVVEKVLEENNMEKPVILISAKEQTGIDKLENTIKEMFFQGELSFNDEIYITNVRQKAALQSAMKSFQLVQQSIENEMPEDFYSIDLMSAYEELGSIIGEAVGEDLVNEIFSKFCMGK